jgi:hypothetical protein
VGGRTHRQTDSINLYLFFENNRKGKDKDVPVPN